MNIVILDGSKMPNIEKAHQYLSVKLYFPEYYGGNLDALWDILSTLCEPIRIILVNKERLEGFLGGYAQQLIKVFREAELTNPNIKFRVLTKQRKNKL